MTVYFLACDIKTGATLAELPLQVSELERALMTVSTASFSLPIADPACPPGWRELVSPWRTIIVAADDSGTIWWAGIPQTLTCKATSAVIEIEAATIESYLARRYVPARRFDQADQCSEIAAWLVASTVDAGIPIDIDAPASGILRDRSYTDDETGTVLQRLTDLAGVIDGPEWWIETTWATPGSQAGIRHVFHTGYPRIGVASDRPQAVFEMPGGLLDLTYEDRWGEGEAATFVQVAGEGEGETKPISTPHVALSQEWGGYPRLELSQSAQNVTELATLEAKAEKTLARLSHGTQVLTLEQKLDAHPRVGIDWAMGDDVRVLVETDSLRLDTRLRLVGWKLAGAMTTVSPIVAHMTEKQEEEKPRESDTAAE